MSKGGRISLHDCGVELLMPSLASFTHEGRASLEDVTLAAAESSGRELTEVYVGETVFLVVVVSGPEYVHTRDSLFGALDGLGDVQVTVGEEVRRGLRKGGVSIPGVEGGERSLPVLRESAWVAVSRGASGGSEGGEGGVDSPNVLCKGLWVLVRTPPEASDFDNVMAMAGKQSIFVSLRERSTSHSIRHVPIFAAITRASRVSGKPIVLSASKSLMVHLPLEVACQQVVAGGSAGRTFVTISARNSTSDAVLSVVPPYIHVSSSAIVSESEKGSHSRSGSATATGLAAAARAAKQDPATRDDNGAVLSLDDMFEFQPQFGVEGASRDCEDDASASSGDQGADERAAAGDGDVHGLKRERSRGDDTNDDFGVFIPAFSRWLKQAVSLGPREVFNFVYAIIPKGDTQQHARHSHVEGTNKDPSSGAIPSSASSAAHPKLAPGMCFQTSVALAWSCSPRDASEAAKEALDQDLGLSREMSSGGMLATGKRSSVAIRVMSVQWKPPRLINDVVVTFSGPVVVPLRASLTVNVCILNQSSRDLRAASLFIQRDRASNVLERRELLAMRTVVSLGHIPCGGSANIELPCVALSSGTLSLGEVCVIDLSAGDGVEPQAWAADTSFEVLVVDQDASIPGDPTP